MIFGVARQFEFAVDEFYHVYNRGNDKRKIFLENKDQERFLNLLFLCNSHRPLVFRDLPSGKNVFELDRGETLVDIGAYCIMYNHFHLLLHEKAESGISRFMQKLLTAYAMFFRTKYQKTGTIFEGTFKARHLDEDRFLEYMFAYINLNPVEHIFPDWKEAGVSDMGRAEKYLSRYPYTSYHHYPVSDRPERVIINSAAFPEYFRKTRDFKAFLRSWLLFKTGNTEV